MRIDPAGIAPSLRRFGRTVADWARGHPLVAALALGAVCLIPVLTLLTPGFNSNDDPAMRAMVDGSAYGARLPHVVFSNVLIGLALKGLYGITGGVPWYAVYLYLALGTALVVLFYAVLSDSRPGPGPRFAGLAGIVGAFGLWALIDLQFTAVSLLLGAAAVLLHLVRSETGPVAVPVAAGVLLGAVSLIRWQSFLAVALLAVPLLAWSLFRISWRRHALFAGTALAVVLAGAAFQAAYYAGNTDWHDYREYNAVRGKLHESAGLAEAADDPDLLAAVGWSRNDLAMFDSWFFTDPERYDLEALRTLEAGMDHTRSLSHAAGLILDQADSPVEAARVALTAGLLLTALLAGTRHRRIALSTTAWFAAVVAWLVFFAKLPQRVAVPILAFLALSLLLLPGTDEAPLPRSQVLRRGTALLLAAVVAAGVIVGAVDARDRSSRHERFARGLDTTAAELAALEPGAVTVAWATQIPIGAALPLERGPLHDLPLIRLGWQQHSPPHRAGLEHHGIEDLYLAIGTRTDVLLPLRSETPAASYLTYLEEHYGFTGILRPLQQVGNLMVYDLAVSYEIGDGVLHERRVDGSGRDFLLDPVRVTGTITLTRTAEASRISGQAADRAGPGPVDRILIMSDGTAVALLHPDRSRGRLADRLGLDPDTPLGFITEIPGGGEVRVFALSGDTAAELRR